MDQQPIEVIALDGKRRGLQEGLSYPWIKTDAGRELSLRPKQRNDCCVRALATTRGIAYDDAFAILKLAGRKCGGKFDIGPWLDKQAWATRIPFPAKKGKQRMTPSSFIRQFPRGTYLCRVAKHVFAVRDGAVFDTHENRADRCVYVAWAVNNDE